MKYYYRRQDGTVFSLTCKVTGYDEVKSTFKLIGSEEEVIKKIKQRRKTREVEMLLDAYEEDMREPEFKLGFDHAQQGVKPQNSDGLYYDGYRLCEEFERVMAVIL